MSDEKQFEGRRVLVTGAASGIGHAVCSQLLARGAKVAALDINQKALENQWKSKAVALAVDITKPDEITAAVKKAADSMGGIDGVVNCAGILPMISLENTPLDLWEKIFSVNLTGTHLVCMAALPWLRQANNSAIVNIASGAGLQPMAGLGAYGTSKAAVIGYTRYLAQELAPKIRVMAVCPGAVDTPMVASALPSEDARSGLAQQYALKRLAQPAEIAEAILFLLSTSASYISGSILAVDGGRTFH